MRGRSVLTVLVSVLPAMIIAGSLAVSPGRADAQAPGASVVEVCKACHAPYVENYLATKHGQKGNLRGPSNRGECLACHGQNALEHAKKGGGKGVGGVFGFNDPKVSADVKSDTCRACHLQDRHLAFWDSGKHRKNEVSCNNCHILHGEAGPGSTIALNKPNPSVTPYQTTVRQLQYETCTVCHKQVRAQLLKPSHHPIIEGKLKCTDCHNPHGALSPAMVNSESIRELCTTCHTDKRGPFIWEHPPVEESCLNCHNPHGSNHNRLLVEKAPNLCQDCHDASRHPGTIYGASGGFNPIPIPPATAAVPNTRLIARGCLNCHYTIHGSNAPAVRGKFWHR